MRQLMLLRHAKSSWDDPGLPDHARPLNARGRRAAAAMAAAMRDLGLTPDIVLVSSARRTLQTLEALTPFEDGALVEPMDALYLAPCQRLIEEIRRTPETARSLLLIGHNPALHDLALTLLGPSDKLREDARRLADGYPSGALVEFALACHWSQLGPGGGRLVRFLAPRDLTGVEMPA